MKLSLEHRQPTYSNFYLRQEFYLQITWKPAKFVGTASIKPFQIAGKLRCIATAAENGFKQGSFGSDDLLT